MSSDKLGNGKVNARARGSRIRRLGNSACKFYFVKPPEDSDADHFAERLMGIKNVEEVFITDGDYGFVVRTKAQGSRSDSTYDYLTKVIGCSFCRVTSHYQYKR